MSTTSWGNRLGFVREEISEIPGLAESKPDRLTALKFFFSRARYSVKLASLEKEIITFAFLQWVSIAIGYYLWVQMLDWIPEEVWRSASESDEGSITDVVLLAWSFFCVGVAALPLGLFSGCMGAAHFLHRQGRSSTIAACMRIVLSRTWSLWVFHWIDGWITVRQILKRLPKDNDRSTQASRALSESLYYAWKLGTMGVLPALLTGQGLVDSGKCAVLVVKDKLKDMAVLRVGYSLACWVIGIAAYAGTLLMFVCFDDLLPQENEAYGHVFTIYAWAGVPILIATGIIQLFLRPIYVISICDIYSDWVEERDETVFLPDDPSKAVTALVAFGVVCLVMAIVYLYRYDLGIMDMLSTPYGEE